VVKNKEGVEFKDYLIINDTAFIHGNKIFPEILDKKIKRIMMGHMHPAISIAKNVKKEIYKCFLVGKWKSKEIIILPSFFPLVEGQDLQIEDTNLAIRLNLWGFEAYVVGDRVYDFGKLREVGRLV
jgi:metallophosphoesterase superfamily enzyme